MHALRLANSRMTLAQHTPCQLSAFNVYSNQTSSLAVTQRRTKVHSFHYKVLFHPKWKRVYKHPRKMKEYMFTDDTLHSLSHGEDYKVKIRVSDYPQMNKRKHKVYPERHILRLWSDILGQFLWLPVSKKGLHKINQAGSLDRYILCTNPRDMNSRLGERLRHRMLRALDRKEEEMMERALDGDIKALPTAYSIVLKQEKDERKALLRRNNWLSQREGRIESRKTKWMRHELQHRIDLIKSGMIKQKEEPPTPLWKEIQEIFDTHRRAKQAAEQQSTREEEQEQEADAATA
mmetsp:Transcript_21512/g.34489  ORF Transcript_21512/g.34489 Transcript_21512/m.34489 type:complete len:291 (+) Transcript_21512:47-919(+)